MRALLKRAAVVVAAVTVLVGLGAGVVNAQSSGTASGNGFRISPVRSDLTVEKGKSTTLTITIENPTDFQTTAKPVVNAFIASDKENGEPVILDENAPRAAKDFRNVVQPISDVRLAPREKKDIPVRIVVPSDARAGGYYGAIRFVPATTNNAGNVSLTASVGTIVLLTVPGNLTEKVDLVQLGASQKGKIQGFLTKGDVSIMARLKNSGDIHVQPFGKVEVKNTFGKTVETYELNSTQPRANVLPDSTRKFEHETKNKKWFGRYTISANIGYSQGSGDVITAKAVFWYVPTWALVVLALFVVAVAVGVYLVVRKLRKTKR
jgi:hypothetical protein